MKLIGQLRITRTFFFTATLMVIFFSALIIFQGCEKSTTSPKNNETASTDRRRPNPQPPVYFYFTNCGARQFIGNFAAGAPGTGTVTFNYINSPGGSYPAYTSATVNGITLRTPAGTLNKGSGSIIFTASGTAVTPGDMTISISIGGSLPCNVLITVLNAPANPANCGGDPGAAIGSTGCVTFTYRGQQVTYSTVRAGDGKIWLRQNLGSPQVAVNSKDEASFGHYFQWGRWDDGHQLKNSPSVTGGPSLRNPSHIPGGNPNFIKGSTAETAWWGTGGAITDTWSGTNPTATNGKDPCVAIGPGWHLPSATEWTNFMFAEAVNDEPSAFESTLRLTLTGYKRSADAFVTNAFTTNFGHYWSNTAAGNTDARNPTASNTSAKVFNIDTYTARVNISERGYGFSCRCVKN
jgi:uncharacterized protein (TIGR02145 family)